MVTASDGPCLICLTPASIADWTAIGEWLAVEGCGCEGFLVSKNLWRSRLVRLPSLGTAGTRGAHPGVALARGRSLGDNRRQPHEGPIVITSLRPSLDP